MQLLNTILTCIIAAFMYIGVSRDPDEVSPVVKSWVLFCFIVAGLNVYTTITTFPSI
jgi:hypothetical protein